VTTPHTYGIINEKGEYMVTQKESHRINKKFEHMRVKRVKFVATNKKAKADKYPNDQN
jgi:hypothetical protein